MEKPQATDGHPTRCERCGKRYREHLAQADQWNVRMVAGYPKGLICPGCQTAGDSLEADVNAALLGDTQLSVIDGDGWTALGEEGRADLIMDTIETRACSVITAHRERAEMAGQTHVEVDVKAWAAEAIDGAQLFAGQSEELLGQARAQAEDTIRQMLRLDG